VNSLAAGRTPSRALAWASCLNVRDLGGLRTTDGRRTRVGALVRADLLCRLNEEGRAALVAHGIRTVIDLRNTSELAADPNPFAEASETGIGYLNLPITSSVNAAGTPAEGYCRGLDGSQREIVQIVSAIARAPEGGVLFHCHAGKDRTGLVAAVALALVGVPDELIVEDYVVLGDFEALAREWVGWIVRHTDDPFERARLLRGAPPDPDVMRALLTYLHGHHGGAEAYLLAGGAVPEDVAALRRRLVD
jgi:protein-tyrosine phosphatase